MGHNGCLVLCQITADEERRVSRRIVVVQYPSLLFPQFRLLPVHSIPQTRYKFLVQLFVHHLTTWYKFMTGQCFPIKNTANNTLIFDRLISAFFFGRGDPFPIHWDGCILVSTSYP